jgi:hypothetical protein
MPVLIGKRRKVASFASALQDFDRRPKRNRFKTLAGEKGMNFKTNPT